MNTNVDHSKKLGSTWSAKTAAKDNMKSTPMATRSILDFLGGNG